MRLFRCGLHVGTEIDEEPGRSETSPMEGLQERMLALLVGLENSGSAQSKQMTDGVLTICNSGFDKDVGVVGIAEDRSPELLLQGRHPDERFHYIPAVEHDGPTDVAHVERIRYLFDDSSDCVQPVVRVFVSNCPLHGPKVVIGVVTVQSVIEESMRASACLR